MDNDSEGTSSALRLVRGLRPLVAPPAGGGNAIDWSRTTAEYGHGFPDDYRAFMQVYGEGTFDGFLYVTPPVSEVYPNPPFPVREETDTACHTAEEEDFDEPDLLIAWGGTVDADLLCWYACDPDPNRWTTVVFRRHWAPPECWTRFDCGSTVCGGPASKGRRRPDPTGPSPACALRPGYAPRPGPPGWRGGRVASARRPGRVRAWRRAAGLL
ncbi:hypothetical protein ACFY00_20220 [Kitasatospora sp. NPDC001540]|uniref:hypothetical protein n=1 Tax=Kitasatospora sp. NPDC001540 TaxID=3364014 RepID=UPI003698865F